MNLTGLCIVIVALLAGATSKSIAEAPANPAVEEKFEEKMTTIKTIADNTTAEIENQKSSRDFESILEDFIAPANELQGPEVGRTFGLKRLQFMMMPMIYKMGVMMTLLVILTVISLKGLAIGVMLLVLKLAVIFGKLFASAHSHGPPAYGWAPPPPQQPVHVHVHNSGGGHDHHPQPYSGWEPSGPPQDEHYYYKG